MGVMNIGVVQRNQPPSAQPAGRIGLAFDEAVHKRIAEVRRTWPVGQVYARVGDCLVNTIDIQGVFHLRVADPKTPADALAVADNDDLCLDLFDTRRA